MNDDRRVAIIAVWQVEENLGRFDANRSSGHLCGATAENFEQVVNHICTVHYIIFCFLVTRFRCYCHCAILLLNVGGHQVWSSRFANEVNES